MLKEFLTRTGKIIPRVLSRTWLTNKYAQALVGQSSGLDKPKSIGSPREGQTKRIPKHLRAASLSKSRKESRLASSRKQDPIASTVEAEQTVKKSKRRQKKEANSVLSFLQDPDLIHANKALYLEGTVTQYRSKLLLRLCKASIQFYNEILAADEKLDIETLERLIGHRFQEPRLLALIFVHFGSIKTDTRFTLANETHGSQLALAWLGDAIQQYIITEQLIARYDTQDNFQLHEARVRLANRRSCGLRAKSLGLDSHLIYGNALVSVSDSLLGEMFEALIGVIYLDGGMEAASLFFARQVEFPDTLADLLKMQSNGKKK